MKILLFGTCGHAKVVTDIIELEGRHQIVGLVSQDGVAGNFVDGYEVVASNRDFEIAAKKMDAKGAIVALGDNSDRKKVVSLIGENLRLVTGIHPSAVVSKNAHIGSGTVIMAMAVVNTATRVGNHCIINTAASVDHDCEVGSFTHLCPGVRIAGCVSIGRECFLGTGAVVIDHINIGNRVIIGAGAAVITDVKNNAVVVGNPAQPKVK